MSWITIGCRKLPTLFRGVFWDAHWEFDAPCVIYSPICRYGFGGNSDHFYQMVEDICIDISSGQDVKPDWSDTDLKEFKWRGWSPRGFSNLKEAWHLEAIVKWDDSGWEGLQFDIEIREQWGPFS